MQIRFLRPLSRVLGLAFLSGIAVAGLISPSYAQNTLERIKSQKSVRVGFSNFAPTSFVGPGGEITGSSPELAKAFFKSLGVEKVEGVVGEFGSLIGGLQAQRFDMIAVAMQIQPRRCEQIAFGDPEMQLLQGFVVKKGNPLALKSFKDVADNRNARLGMLTGAGQIRFADIAGVTRDQQILFPDFDKSVAGLQAGRVEAAAGASVALKYILSKINSPEVEFAELSQQPVDEKGQSVTAYAGMGFRQGDTELLGAWNAWLRAARQSGEALRIMAPFGLGENDIAPVSVTAQSLCQNR
ncbi:ectoine/hydroxyectoine ABC transporter substrate-binding protein EhuB [Bosea sp. 2YAB26]|uniref:ectoine/hydroxyectoine ABC transporter substrate-binding protein EhuB n=1 Tax=Bosea sp. 2YAB26 TaxID=3237478 RepID=UPI003F8DB661